MTRILLLSCSGRKRATLVPLPAGLLYTGVFYTMIAKARREQQWPSDITIGIVSAEHGFLKETDLLLPYDRRMDESRARELQRAIGESLDAFFSQHQPTESMVALGNPYRLSIAHSQELVKRDENGQVVWAHGGLGEQLHQVHRWIRKEPGS